MIGKGLAGVRTWQCAVLCFGFLACIAVQPAAFVGPGQVSWFQFTVQAPMTPGTYRLYLRPLVEGATWMEDYGVFWLVTVRG